MSVINQKPLTAAEIQAFIPSTAAPIPVDVQVSQYLDRVTQRLLEPADPTKPVTFFENDGSPMATDLAVNQLLTAFISNDGLLIQQQWLTETINAYFSVQAPDWKQSLFYRRLAEVQLPIPDPIDAIYDFNDDVLASLTANETPQGATFAVNWYAYLSQTISIDNLRIAVFTTTAERDRVVTDIVAQSANIKPDFFDNLFKNNDLPVFLMNDGTWNNKNYTLINQALGPYFVQPTLTSLICPTKFMILSLEDLLTLSYVQLVSQLSILAKNLQSLLSFNYKNINDIQSLTELCEKLTHKSSNEYRSSKAVKDLTKRSSVLKFHKHPTSLKEKYHLLNYLLNHQARNTSGKIFLRKVVKSYAIANRRHPDSPDKPGKALRNQQYPDIFVYLDTSGSVSSQMYECGIKSIAALAIKLNIPLYFVSFATYISQPVFVSTKGRSLKSVLKQINRIPKASGGTEFENVWSMINKLNTKSINLVITDFQYDVRNDLELSNQSPAVKNTYYLGFDGDEQELVQQHHYAKQLCKQLYRQGLTNVENHFYP